VSAVRYARGPRTIVCDDPRLPRARRHQREDLSAAYAPRQHPATIVENAKATRKRERRHLNVLNVLVLLDLLEYCVRCTLRAGAAYDCLRRSTLAAGATPST
jgi:hypothetical protein